MEVYLPILWRWNDFPAAFSLFDSCVVNDSIDIEVEFSRKEFLSSAGFYDDFIRRLF